MNPNNARDQLVAWAKTDFSYFVKGETLVAPAPGDKERVILLTGDTPGAVLMYGKVAELRTSLTYINDKIQGIGIDPHEDLCINFRRFKPQILINIGPLRGWWRAQGWRDAGKPYKWKSFGDRLHSGCKFANFVNGLHFMEKPPKDWDDVFGYTGVH